MHIITSVNTVDDSMVLPDPNFSETLNGKVLNAHFTSSAGEALAVTQHSYLFPLPTDEKF